MLCRKPKHLQLGAKNARLGDLNAAILATILARSLPFLTENTIFALGGELLEVGRMRMWNGSCFVK